MIELLCSEILNNIPSAIIIFDKNYKILHYNKSFKKVFKPKINAITLGECLNCAFLTDNCVCGEGIYCKTCFLKMIIDEVINKKLNVKGKFFDKRIKLGNEYKNYRIRLSVTALKNDYYCCIMEDITEVYGKTVKYFNKKMNMDFKRAKTIQSLMLPSFDKLNPLADFTYFYRQNYLVGGDIFDVFKYDENRFGGYIADVSGQGISGGMLTVYMHENYPDNIFSPAKSLTEFANNFNTLKLSEESYITAFAFSVDILNKKLYVCNAGHSIPAIIKRKNEVKLIYIRGKTVSNWYQGISYNDLIMDYQSGDMLILMTDGIPDLKNKKGEYYTFDRAKNIIEKAPCKMDYILEKIEIDMVQFYKGIQPQDADDKVLLIIELK